MGDKALFTGLRANQAEKTMPDNRTLVYWLQNQGGKDLPLKQEFYCEVKDLRDITLTGCRSKPQADEWTVFFRPNESHHMHKIMLVDNEVRLGSTDDPGWRDMGWGGAGGELMGTSSKISRASQNVLLPCKTSTKASSWWCFPSGVKLNQRTPDHTWPSPCLVPLVQHPFL